MEQAQKLSRLCDVPADFADTFIASLYTGIHLLEETRARKKLLILSSDACLDLI